MKVIDSSHEVVSPTFAMFYSVNSPHVGLAGLDLATMVIKRAAEELKYQYQSLRNFCTLSPIPGFLNWLKSAQSLNSLKLPAEHMIRLQVAREKHTIKNGKIFTIDNSNNLLTWLHSLLTETTPLWTLDDELCAR